MAVGYDMFASIMTTQTLKHFTFTSITKFFVAPIFLLLYLALPISVHAKVVINEVFANPSGELSEPTEFIELYSDEAIDLEGYTLYDLTKTYTITGVSLAANEYAVFTRAQTSIQLNNDVETVTLKDASANQIDTISYGNTIEDKSWSRVPNFTGNFENNTDKTPGAANAAPPATATPTSTPTPSPSPTSQTTSTPTVVTSPTSTPTPTEKADPTPTAREALENPDVVLGLRNELATPTPTGTDEKKSQNSSKKFPFAALGFVTAGGGLMTAAIVPAVRKKKTAKGRPTVVG